MSIQSFDDIRHHFMARVQRIVWATVSTQDTEGRLRSRILHPIWKNDRLDSHWPQLSQS